MNGLPDDGKAARRRTAPGTFGVGVMISHFMA
jgi:hypothetical protein